MRACLSARRQRLIEDAMEYELLPRELEFEFAPAPVPNSALAEADVKVCVQHGSDVA